MLVRREMIYLYFLKVIYLDAGHGGADSGAFYKNVKESDLNLVILIR